MTTSGTTISNPVRDIVVKRALRLVGAYSTGSEPRAVQLQDAIEAVNMMIKSWQIQGFLWVKEFQGIPLVEGQTTYPLPDALTIDYKPTRIFSAWRRDTSGNDVPLNPMSREGYGDQVNKTSKGRITQYYFDAQLETAKLYVWPAPDASGDSLVIDCDRPLEVMIDSSNTYDFPQEWIEVLCYGLATRLAPEYAVPLNERQLLQQEYMALREHLMSYNIDYTSTILGVDTHG